MVRATVFECKHLQNKTVRVEKCKVPILKCRHSKLMKTIIVSVFIKSVTILKFCVNTNAILTVSSRNENHKYY